MIDRLVALGLNEDALARVQLVQAKTGEPLPVVISRLGLLPDNTVASAMAEHFGLAALVAEDIPQRAIELPVQRSFLRAHYCLPVSLEGETLTLAVVDPSNPSAASGVAFGSGYRVVPIVIGFHSWRTSFEALYANSEIGAREAQRAGARWADDTGGARDMALDAPAVRLVEELVADAAEAEASDIHVERKPGGTSVRFRIDGRLEAVRRLPQAMGDALVARLKVLGDLDVANHRRAQDGRTTLSVRGRPVDVRLSIIPSVHGEAAVIRLLDRGDVRLDFSSLGFSQDEAERIRVATDRQQGLFLVAGPTGGGKTTTLYSVIHALRASDRKIVTVEDPIEYFFDDVHQTQLDATAGLGFAEALRAFLRHDPDVILVGEIRDAETAKTAVQAALTGHLVLSTLHAKSAAHVPTRLVEMGVEPYLVASTLTATTAQRLVRRLCPACAAPSHAPAGLFEKHGIVAPDQQDFRQPVGCASCHGGFRGRVVISETVSVSDPVRAAIQNNEAPGIEKARTLLADGLAKASQGITSIDEVLRAVEIE